MNQGMTASEFLYLLHLISAPVESLVMTSSKREGVAELVTFRKSKKGIKRKRPIRGLQFLGNLQESYCLYAVFSLTIFKTNGFQYQSALFLIQLKTGESPYQITEWSFRIFAFHFTQLSQDLQTLNEGNFIKMDCIVCIVLQQNR